MEMVSRLSFMDVGVDSDPSLSPELNLGTMNTSDMFETGWENSSGIESGMSATGSNSSPFSGLTEENLFLWDDAEHLDANLFQANLGDYFGDDGDFLSLTDNQPPFETSDFSFLQDSASNMSFASDISSSSSTITSYSIPDSPDHSMAMLEEEQLATTLPLSTSSPLKPSPEVNSCLRESSPEAKDIQVPQTVIMENEDWHRTQQEDKKRTKEQEQSSHFMNCRGTSPKKAKKNRRNPLSTQLPQKSSGHAPSVPVSLTSEPSRVTKKHTKENNFSPSKKVVNILDSTIKWSELSDSEQSAVGDGLEMVLSQCIGVRERLDLMALLEPETIRSGPINYDDMEWTINLDDEKLEILRRFLRTLDCPDSHADTTEPRKKSMKAATKKTKKMKTEEEWHSFPKEKIKLSKNRKPIWDTGSKTPLSKKQLSNLPRPGPHSGKSWSSLTKSSKMKLNLPKASPSKNPERKCSDLPLLRTRSRKEYRQLMKEKRSGLFEREEVVTLSGTVAPVINKPSDIKEEDEDEDEDIDILG